MVIVVHAGAEAFRLLDKINIARAAARLGLLGNRLGRRRLFRINLILDLREFEVVHQRSDFFLRLVIGLLAKILYISHGFIETSRDRLRDGWLGFDCIDVTMKLAERHAHRRLMHVGVSQ